MKNAKKLVCLALALIFVLSLCSCGAKRESAETVVSKSFDAIKSLDIAAITKYWNDDAFDEFITDGDDSLELVRLLTKNLSYKIVSSKEEADTATVTVDITNLDMGPIIAKAMSDLIPKVLEYAFLPEDQQPSDEEINKMMYDSLSEIMSAEDNKTVTNTVDVRLELVEDNWKIDTDDTIVDALLGGMISASTNLLSD